MKTALFIPALVSLGAYGAGAVHALVEEGGLSFDLVAASSGGVIAGAFAATGQTAQLVDIWRTWRNKDIAAVDWRALLRGGVFWARNVMSNEPQWRTAIEPHISAAGLLPGVRLRFHMTNLTLGAEEIVEYPGATMPFLTAIRAAIAVPGLFPPVTYEGMDMADGAILNGSPFARLLRGADVQRVFVVGLAPRQPTTDGARHAPGRLHAALQWNQHGATYEALAQVDERNEALRAWQGERDAVRQCVANLVTDPHVRADLLSTVDQLYEDSPLPGWQAPLEVIPVLPRQKLDGLFGDFKPERSQRLLQQGREDALAVLESLK